MKNFKNILRILLTSASMLGFLGGWATLAHSRKPVLTTNTQPQPQALEPLAPLAPLPSIGSSVNNNSNSSGNGLLNIIVPPASTTHRPRAARSLFSTSGS